MIDTTVVVTQYRKEIIRNPGGLVYRFHNIGPKKIRIDLSGSGNSTDDIFLDPLAVIDIFIKNGFEKVIVDLAPDETGLSVLKYEFLGSGAS